MNDTIQTLLTRMLNAAAFCSALASPCYAASERASARQFGAERSDWVSHLAVARVAESVAGNTTAATMSTYECNSIIAKFANRGAGDYDLDADIDGHDLLAWQRSIGSTTDLAADGDGSGEIDAGDLTVWREHVADRASGPLFSVAEPDAEALLLIGSILIGRMRRRRQ